MFLEVEKLNKSYRTHNKNNELIEDLLIFKDLNFSIGDEKIITIYGPSGIGKTTFLNMLGTVDQQDSGTIALKSIKYTKDSYPELRLKHIGYIFQFHFLLPEFTIYENLDIILSIKKMKTKQSKDMIIDYLDRFSLTDKLSKYPYQLSGGEKQRLSVLRAVISKPSMILADEPTGNLDANNSALLVDYIQSISADFNIKFIIGTHDKSFESISDNIYEINNYQFLKNK